jgi:hypothetical protein
VTVAATESSLALVTERETFAALLHVGWKRGVRVERWRAENRRVAA